jgi:hypothetical protein
VGDGEQWLRHDDGPRCQATEPHSDDIYSQRLVSTAFFDRFRTPASSKIIL